jgi:hypothetical protein
MSILSSIKNYTLIKDVKKESGDKNCASKSLDCSPYVLLDKKAGDIVKGQVYDPTKLEVFDNGGMFIIDKSYFKEFQNGGSNNIDEKSNNKLYIFIGIGVLAIGLISYFVIKNK